MTLTKVLRDRGFADVATAHGFRSSFRDWATESAKVREVVAEAALAHTVRDKTEAACRRAAYLDERKSSCSSGRATAASYPQGAQETGPANLSSRDSRAPSMCANTHRRTR
jgi:hypothetical protein